MEQPKQKENVAHKQHQTGDPTNSRFSSLLFIAGHPRHQASLPSTTLRWQEETVQGQSFSLLFEVALLHQQHSLAVDRPHRCFECEQSKRRTSQNGASTQEGSYQRSLVSSQESSEQDIREDKQCEGESSRKKKVTEKRGVGKRQERRTSRMRLLVSSAQSLSHDCTDQDEVRSHGKCSQCHKILLVNCILFHFPSCALHLISINCQCHVPVVTSSDLT